MYCRQCLYVLDGLPENRCPECGNVFDPADPRSFRKHPSYPAPRASLASIACAFSAPLLLIITILQVWPPLVGLALVLPISGAALILAALGIVRSHGRNSLAWTALVIALLLIAFLVVALRPTYI
jgi:CHASE2 domain-containing sensor protein